MPIYEYKCQSCNKEIELFQKISEPPLEKCESCGGKLKKLMSRNSFILLGDGWFATSSKKETKNKNAK